MNSCHFCKKPAPEHHNYCNWECMVEEAKQNGGKIHTPNGLPIRSIDRNGDMWEHEHGDHPDYKFPVDVEYCGPEEDAPHFVNGNGERTGDKEMDDWLRHQTHALIYCDGSVVITMYECCYAMWYVRDGKLGGGSIWREKGWRLAEGALEQIRKQCHREV